MDWRSPGFIDSDDQTYITSYAESPQDEETKKKYDEQAKKFSTHKFSERLKRDEALVEQFKHLNLSHYDIKQHNYHDLWEREDQKDKDYDFEKTFNYESDEEAKTKIPKIKQMLFDDEFIALLNVNILDRYDK